MKPFIYLISILAFQNLFCQQIKGKILDQSGQPLSNATIYYDGSTVGTLSKSDGTFSIDFTEQSNLTLVVRYLGYQTFYLPNPDLTTNYKITLSPEKNQLDEVVLEASVFTRKEMLKAFKRDFLGETKAGKKTQILNEEDIRFYFDKKEKSLFASSRNTIKVINKELGYRIEFDLIEFSSKFSLISLDEKHLRSNYFGGTSFFEDIEKDNKSVVKKRLKAYKGSPMHFFKSLSFGRLKKEKFKIFHKGFQVVTSTVFNISEIDEGFEVSILGNDFDSIDFDSIKFDKGFTKNRFQKKIAVLYKNDRSNINFKIRVFYIDDYGNHTHLDKILFSGEMSKSRLGEMLPISYEPNE